MGHWQKQKPSFNTNESRHTPSTAGDRECISSFSHHYLPISGWARPCWWLGFKRNVVSMTCLSLHPQTPQRVVTIMEFLFGGMVVAVGGEHRDKQNIGSAVSADVNQDTASSMKFYIFFPPKKIITVCTISVFSFFFFWLNITDNKFCPTPFQTHLPQNQYRSQSVTTQHAQAEARAQSSWSNLWVVSIFTALSIFNVFWCKASYWLL